MVNLSQIQNRDKIIDFFREGLQELFPSLHFHYSPDKEKTLGVLLDIRIRNNVFGYFIINGQQKLPKEVMGLIQNAVQMLAVILESRALDQQLRDENKKLETAANENLEQLHQSIAALEKAKKASINLIEDLTAEIEKNARYQEELAASEVKYRMLIEHQSDLVVKVDREGRFLFVSPSYCRMFNQTESALLGKTFLPLVHEDDRESTLEAMKALEKPPHQAYLEQRAYAAQGWVWIAWVDTAVLDEEGRVKEVIGVGRNITEQKEAEAALKKIEWMLQKGKTRDEDSGSPGMAPDYGDLSSLNTSRRILNAVGAQMLGSIVKDYLGLLDSSTAIYELNGDYALGLFSSGWCRFLDASSRKNCQTDDNREALNCAEWHCHRSCWDDASLPAIKQGKPVDIECNGGIRIYALPIRSGDQIIGAINFGYGDPPRDYAKLREIADKYQVPVGILREKAVEYETRPPFIIETAKDRLAAAAKLIGEIVRRKSIEEQLRQINLELESAVHHKTQELRERVAELERFQDATIEREFRMKEIREELTLLKKQLGKLD